MKNLIAITAILALASSTAVNAKKDRHTNRLHKKNQRKLERNLRRGQVEQIDNLKKKRINQRIANDNKKSDIDGLEEDVTFWTNMVRKTQVTSLPGGPVDPDFGVDPPVDPDFGVDPPVDPDFGVDPPIPSPTPPLPPPTTDGGDVVASICAAGETCIEVGEICSDGTTEECCGETFDSFTCECGSNLLYGSCGATNACLDIVCEGDGTGVDEDGTGGDVPPPAEGFICPDASFVGCTAVDPSNPVDECPTVGEPCPDGNNGEFCCNDGCPRRYCTAKQAPPSLTKKSMVDFVAEIDHAEVAAALAGGN